MARPYRAMIAALVLIGVVRFALQLATPWGVRVLLDGALKNTEGLTAAAHTARLHQVYSLTLVLTIALVMRCLYLYGEAILTGKLGNRLIFDLRRRLYTHIQRLSLSFFDRKRAGSIGSRILNDISVAQTLISGGVLSLALDTVTLLFMVALLFRLEWHLTLVSLLVMPAYVVTLGYLNPRIRSASSEIQEKFSEISGTVYEAVAGIHVVQAFTQERASERQFVHETHGHYNRLMARVRLNAWLTVPSTFLTGLGTVLILAWGGELVLAGQMTVGTLVQFYSYVAFLYGPLSRFADISQVYQTAMAAVDRVFEILDTQPDVTEPPHARRELQLQGQVTFENVSFGYTPDRPVLHGINLTVEPGQMIAFVGPSGSGKTTLTKLLLRFYDVTEGVIRFDGQDIRELPLRELRRQVGAVLQEPILFSGSVRDNILFGRPSATEEEVIGCSRAAPASPSPTGSPQSSTPTRSLFSTTVGSSSRERTRSSSGAAVSTPSCPQSSSSGSRRPRGASGSTGSR
jgi:subfamily B ATP-binding cassette protein MsbA